MVINIIEQEHLLLHQLAGRLRNHLNVEGRAILTGLSSNLFLNIIIDLISILI